MIGRRVWTALAAPGMLWLGLFFLVAFYADRGGRAGQRHRRSTSRSRTGTRSTWNVGYIVQAFQDVLPGGRSWDVFWRTLLYVLIAVVLSLAIGYPVAYYVSRHAGRWKAPLLVLLVMPFWISYLMRMFAWTNLLDSGGYAARALQRAVDRLAVRQARAAGRATTGWAGNRSR